MSLFRHSAHFWSFGASFFWQFWSVQVISDSDHFVFLLINFGAIRLLFNSPFLRILEKKVAVILAQQSRLGPLPKGQLEA